jgi:acyl-CoA thioester hydrolase
MKYFDFTTRVRYSETDQLHIAYYGRYFEWFEAARVEYIRALGISYADLESQGYFLPVVEASCQYKQPARYDDELTVRTWISQLKNTSLHFRYEVFKEKNKVLLAKGQTVHAFVNKDMKPVRVPDLVRNRVEIVA